VLRVQYSACFRSYTVEIEVDTVPLFVCLFIEPG
jgi:hypothetical protein